jgi:hypothetical protein
MKAVLAEAVTRQLLTTAYLYPKILSAYIMFLSLGMHTPAKQAKSIYSQTSGDDGWIP